MFVLTKYRNRKIAIYGMGMSGYSSAIKLKSLHGKVICWDDNIAVRKRIKKLSLTVDKFWKNKNSIDYIVVSPGIDIKKSKIKNYLKKNIKKIITDLDLFFELNKNENIISITGTNGKSTTCKIIQNILNEGGYTAKVGGNIGKPVLSLETTKKNDIFILEVSSYQLQYSKLFRSKHAAILNISPDHLERHRNIKEYVKIKSKIFFAQKNSDYSYINSDNKYSKLLSKIIKLKRVKSKLIKINKKDFRNFLKKINNQYFVSKGYIENLGFAYKIAKTLKIKESIIIKAVNKFKGLPHRQELIFSNKKLICINDSKATSFDACLQSLSNYDQIYWILGGSPKYQDSFNLINVRKKIIKAYIIGKNAPFFVQQIRKKIAYKISYNLKNSIKDICKDIKKNGKTKNTILLSPAAASFDQFKNFEDRGNQFKALFKNRAKNLFYV